MTHRWDGTPKAEAFAHYYQQGLSDNAIAIALGVNHKSVWHYRNSIGLPPNSVSLKGTGHKRRKEYLDAIAAMDRPTAPVIEYVDAAGHTIKRCPPAWAPGARPQKNIRQRA